jgi:hypothetical protein
VLYKGKEVKQVLEIEMSVEKEKRSDVGAA